MYFLIFLALILASFWHFRVRQRNDYKLPPGPLGLPILGNIHQLIVKNPYEKLSQWADKFGKIYTIDLCTKPAVVINDPKLMRDIFNTFSSTGKFQTDSMLRISEGPYGVLNSEGEEWSEQRLFCMKKLKEFGFGNRRMETLILSEAEEVCDWITKAHKKNNGKPLLIQPIFLQSVINTMWTMVSGTRITLGDSKITKLLETFSKTFQHTMKTGLTFLPWLKYVAPELSGYTAYSNACQDITEYIQKEFLDHKKSFLAGAHRDLIDAYIEESYKDSLKWKNAIATVVELFLASSETTGSTLTWLLGYLSVNPDIQVKLQEEIDTIIGENQQVSLDHKSRMPYTEAVIMETMRLSSFVPMGVLHRLLEDLEIDNYKFPKGLVLIPNIYHCHNNKDVWTDPERFRPERFLDEQGEKLREHFVPFQQGKRQCVGEPLAKDMLFIYVTRIFQLFNVSPDKCVKPEDYYEPDLGYVLFPPSLGLHIQPRIK